MTIPSDSSSFNSTLIVYWLLLLVVVVVIGGGRLIYTRLRSYHTILDIDSTDIL